MNLKNVSAMLLFACVLLSLTVLPCSTRADVFKPISDQLIIYSYADPAVAYGALKNCEIDIYASPLTTDQYNDAVADPNIVIAPITELGMHQLDLNNNYSLAERPESVYGRSPTSYLSFRKALTYLTDKDSFVDGIQKGMAARIDVPLSANDAHKMWWNPNCTGENWPWDSDFCIANAILDVEFPQGSTPNPWYDPMVPCSAEYLRTYPTGHLKEGQDLDPIIFYVRIDSPPIYAFAELFRISMGLSGILVDFRLVTFAGAYDAVFTRKDYQIYTGAWGLFSHTCFRGWGTGRFPLVLFFLLNSMWWNPDAPSPNYVVPTGMYPDLDNATMRLYLAQTYAEAEQAAKDAQWIFVKNCITIPLYTARSVMAYKCTLGLVNMDGVGLVNDYSLITAYRAVGGPIRIGIAPPPVQLNPFYSSASSDYLILDRLFQPLMSVAPYDILTDQPWIAQDWERGAWIDPDTGEVKDMLTYWIRKDWLWQDLVQLTAADYKFSMQLLYQCTDAWNWHETMDIHHIKIINPTTVEVYMDLSTIWTLYFPTWPIIPKHAWQREPLVKGPLVETFHEGTNLTTPGSVPLSAPPCWIDSVTADVFKLVECTDYGWVKGELVIYADLPECTDVVVTYWAKGEVAGVLPGLLPWNEVLVSNGQWMITEYNDPTLAGGWVVMEPNPCNSIDVPQGEVDWRWNWVAGPKPRSGYFKIDIYDVVAACKAYGTSGTGDPPPEWGRPLADVAPPCGLINIYDVVTITGKYEATFGQPDP